MISNKEIKNAFLYAIEPRINLVTDDKYWDYMLLSSNNMFALNDQWVMFNNIIKDNYDNNIELYNEDISNLFMSFSIIIKSRHKLLPTISKEDYDEDLFLFNCEHNTKNYMKNGYFYLSIDLKDSIFQGLEKFGLFGNETYVDFVSRIVKVYEVFRLRQIKMTCARIIDETIGIQYVLRMSMALLSIIYNSKHEVIEYIKNNNLKLVKILNDELIFEIGEKNILDSDFINRFCGKDFVANGVNFHVNLYQYKLIHYTYNNKEFYKTIFDYPLTGRRKFNSKSCIYTWQLNKLYDGEELNELDKVQYINGKIVPFTDEIKILRD